MHKLLVFSIDALITEDIPKLLEMPAVQRLGKKMAIAKDLAPIYPALTYPCHVSIMTGTYPDRHGVVENDRFSWKGSNEWLWWSSNVKEPTMIDVAHANGLTTATVCWPVTCGNIADYNLGEIWTCSPDEDEDALFARANSIKAEPVYQRNKHLLDGMRTPGLDLYAAQAARDVWMEAAPDLMFVHFAYLDHQRHQKGVQGPALDPAYAFINDRIEEVLSAVEESGLLEETNVAFLGDHGQLDVHTVVYLNRIFRERGVLGTEDHPGLIAHAASCSAQIHVRGMSEEEALQILLSVKEQYPQWIQEVYTKDTLEKRDYVTGEFSFIVEACDGFSFGKDRSEGVLALSVDEPGLEWMHANHGHHPHKGPKPPLVLFGPDAKDGVCKRGGSITDIAPTLMGILGLSMPNPDGYDLGLVNK